jgi:hypothetical protein
MFTTDNQTALKEELNLMFTEQGAAFTAGYTNQMAQEMLRLLPKRKQKEFVNTVAAFNGRQLVSVKNCLSGQEVEIRREDLGTVCDPSTERFHSM